MSDSPSLYVDGDTLLHRLAPRAKLALSAALFVWAYAFLDPVLVLVPLALALLAILFTGAIRNLLRLWFIIVALFVVGLVVWPAFTPPLGPVVVDLPFFEITRRQLTASLARSLRIVSFIVTGVAFISTTSNEEIVRGLRGLGIPYAFCFAIGTALRLFPTFLGAAGTVRQAQEARGLDLSASNPIARVRKFVPLLIPVFMTAFRNVQTQAMALEARGFDTRRDRTFHDEQSFDAVDWAATGLSLLVIVAVVAVAVAGVDPL
jgi:energy-coupling factor transporter transmembrane protein EcfT